MLAAGAGTSFVLVSTCNPRRAAPNLGVGFRKLLTPERMAGAAALTRGALPQAVARIRAAIEDAG